MQPAVEMSWHVLRFPAAASTATICGCRSSVREMEGNSSTSAQPNATAAESAESREAGRQRKIQTLAAITATATQSRLRLISMRFYRSFRLSGLWFLVPLVYNRTPNNAIVICKARLVFTDRSALANSMKSIRPPLVASDRDKLTHAGPAACSQAPRDAAALANLAPWVGDGATQKLQHSHQCESLFL